MECKSENLECESYLTTTSNSCNSQIISEKIDVEDLIKDFKIFKIDIFSTYLTSLWEVHNIIKK
jgi:hypothetical protein